MNMLERDENTSPSPRRMRVNPYIQKRRFTRLRFGLVLLVLSFASSVQGQDKATLAWKFEKGDELTVQFEQTQNVLTRIDVRDRVLDSELVLVVSWKVVDVADDGNATIEQTIDRIRIKTGAPGDEIKKVVDIDTASDTKLRGVSRDVMKQVKTLVGLKFVVEMTPAGKIVTVTPGPKVAAVVGALPATSALGRIFTAAAMTKLVSDSTMVLPSNSVAKGESWNENSKITMVANDGRTFIFDRGVKSTLQTVDESKANIDVEITLTQVPFAGANSGTELTSPLELLSFTGGGKTVFDRSVGAITSSTFSTQMKTRVIYRDDQVKTTTNVTNKMTVTRK